MFEQSWQMERNRQSLKLLDTLSEHDRERILAGCWNADLDGLLQSLIPFEVDRYLDVGTGGATRTRRIKSRVRLDNDASFDVVRDLGVSPFICADALTLTDFLKPKQFDLVTALDVIEHQTKENGYKLIEVLEELCYGRVIFFTPIGEWAVGEHGRKYQDHLSGWLPRDFLELGYTCLVLPKFHPIFENGVWKDATGAFYAIKDFARPVKTVYIEHTLDLLDSWYWLLPRVGQLNVGWDTGGMYQIKNQQG